MMEDLEYRIVREDGTYGGWHRRVAEDFARILTDRFRLDRDVVMIEVRRAQ